MNETLPKLPPGRVDLHSHVLPGIDDGCQNLDEVVTSIDALKRAGFVGSVCTPHIWGEMFPQNTPAHIAAWVEQLRRELAGRGVEYQLWTGGELRLYDGVTDWLKTHGVPTLADSRYVLMDFWIEKWARWINKSLAWLLEQGYTPIVAHPERTNMDGKKLEAKMDELAREGVLFQGNFQCMTGEAGFHADQRIRHWLAAGRYTFLAMDMHRPEGLEARLDGMTMVETEFGRATLDKLTRDNPRQLVLGA